MCFDSLCCFFFIFLKQEKKEHSIVMFVQNLKDVLQKMNMCNDCKTMFFSDVVSSSKPFGQCIHGLCQEIMHLSWLFMFQSHFRSSRTRHCWFVITMTFLYPREVELVYFLSHVFFYLKKRNMQKFKYTIYYIFYLCLALIVIKQ